MEPLHYKHWPKNVPKTFALPRTTLYYNLEVSATRYPDKTAVSYYGSPISYNRLKTEADALAGYLQQQCGTTGNPKGCMHTHSTLMATAALAGIWSNASPEEVILAVVPFFHITGMQVLMNGTIYLGGELVVMTRGERPDIQEACVIGAQDARRGETVKAVIVLREAAKGKVTEEAVIDWCKEKMAAYKYPRVVEFAEALPKSATGKVQWRLLQEKENAQRG